MDRILTVQCVPKHDDAFTHMVFMPPDEVGAPYVSIGRFVYRCSAHPDVKPRHIAMNAIHRRENLKVVGDLVSVSDFLMPMRNFDIKSVTLEAEWLMGDSSRPPFVMADLANKFRTQFEGHVLAPRQVLVMDVNDDKLLFTVKSGDRGLLTMQSEVGVQWIG